MCPNKHNYGGMKPIKFPNCPSCLKIVTAQNRPRLLCTTPIRTGSVQNRHIVPILHCTPAVQNRNIRGYSAPVAHASHMSAATACMFPVAASIEAKVITFTNKY